ncbi:hypothetical protein FJ364_03335 [Candidatus Dependentiae bacterium]|nr:hypothetical protein [Candidatus Dependentiae bacterium]
MKKFLTLTLMLIASVLSNTAICSKTDVVVQQIKGKIGSEGKPFKTILAATSRHGELTTFRELVFAVGLQFPLRNYGKKKPKSRKSKAFLALIPRGQKITVLAPIGSALVPLSSALKQARQSKDRAAIKAANDKILEALKAHIIKGEIKKEACKGMLTTIGGQQINADNLVFQRADIKAKNGYLHIIRYLSTDESRAAKTAESTPTPAPTESKPAQDSASTDAKPAEEVKPATPTADVPAVTETKPAEETKPAADAKAAEAATT